MAATRIGVAPPAQINIRPNGRYSSVTVEDALPAKRETRAEAVAYVSRVLNYPGATKRDFEFAMGVSERFDIRARDILEYRKG